MNMRTQFSVGFALVCLLVGFVFAAHAAGLEVAPPRIDMRVSSQAVTSRLRIFNPTSDVQLFTVSLDQNLEGLSIRPQSFTLEAGASTEVQVVAQPLSKRIFSGAISIVARPLAGPASEVGGGVKVPIAIEYATATVWYAELSVWLKVLGLAIFMVLVFFARPKTARSV